MKIKEETGPLGQGKFFWRIFAFSVVVGVLVGFSAETPSWALNVLAGVATTFLLLFSICSAFMAKTKQEVVQETNAEVA